MLSLEMGIEGLRKVSAGRQRTRRWISRARGPLRVRLRSFGFRPLQAALPERLAARAERRRVTPLARAASAQRLWR